MVLRAEATSSSHNPSSVYSADCVQAVLAAHSLACARQAWKRSHLCLKLLALIVQVAHGTQSRLLLELEEGVMQHLVVNVQFAHLRLHPIPLLLLRLFVGLLLLHHKIGDAEIPPKY